MRKLGTRLRYLAKDQSAAILIETAFALPLILFIGLAGLELVNYTMIHTRLNQVALATADNASRIAVANGLSLPKVREVDVYEVFRGAALQSPSMDLQGKGRLILSSLESKSNGFQRIEWQRCFGNLVASSSYGIEGRGRNNDNSLSGMGPAGKQIKAVDDAAVMFVEAVYEYEPMIYTALIDKQQIRATAAFNIREGRDLTKIYNDAPAVTPLRC